MVVDETLVDAMVLGGAVLGGGGGGSLLDGRRLGRKALEIGTPVLKPHSALPDDAMVVTVSTVGAPSAHERHVEPEDYIRAVEGLLARIDGPIAGLITSENGGAGTTNGLIQSAALGLPVVDAPCDGRAHPTGVMGSMGLGKIADYVSRQMAVGGNPRTARRVELYVEAALGRADHLVRQAAVEAGGLVAVARNPVRLDYVREHGAPGAISMAIELGQIVLETRGRGGLAVAEQLAEALGGEVLAAGDVEGLVREARGGYDVGRLRVDDLELLFWNEFMAVDRAGRRVATFPDLVTTIDAATGMPRTTAELQSGEPVVVLYAPASCLILGAGVRDPEGFVLIEQVLGRSMRKYVFGDLP